MAKVKVYVKLKPTVLDAQGQTIRNALLSLGYDNLENLRAGKYFELDIRANGRPVEEEVREMCERLLANPVMEEYSFVVEDGTAGSGIPAAGAAALETGAAAKGTASGKGAP